jgi:hypothetical protein
MQTPNGKWHKATWNRNREAFIRALMLGTSNCTIFPLEKVGKISRLHEPWGENYGDQCKFFVEFTTVPRLDVLGAQFLEDEDCRHGVVIPLRKMKDLLMIRVEHMHLPYLYPPYMCMRVEVPNAIDEADLYVKTMQALAIKK